MKKGGTMDIYRFFSGYVKAEIKGGRLERFINIIINKKIYIWDVIKKSDGTVEFYVSKKGYDKINDIAQEHNIICEKKQEYGFLYFMKNIKRRWMFAVFVPVSLCILFLFSSVIWSVEITKADYVSEKEIRAALKELGLSEGKLKYNIDYKNAANVLLTKFDELIWANVELEGTKLVVTLQPRKKAPEFIDKDTPCNLVAKKDGYIISVTAENGEKIVKPGDTVIKGQTLVSGIVQSMRVGARYVHSLGEVKAKTWTEKIKEQKLYKYDKIYTGETKKYTEADIFSFKIPIYFKKNIDFYNYDSIIKESNIFFLGFKKYEYREYTLKKTKISINEAVKLCSDELLNEIKKETENIKTKKITYDVIDDETINVRVFVESEENIAQSEKIVTDKTVR